MLKGSLVVSCLILLVVVLGAYFDRKTRKSEQSGDSDSRAGYRGDFRAGMESAKITSVGDGIVKALLWGAVIYCTIFLGDAIWKKVLTFLGGAVVIYVVSGAAATRRR